MILCILALTTYCESKTNKQITDHNNSTDFVILDEMIDINTVIDAKKDYTYTNFLDSIKISQKDSIEKKHGVNLLKMSLLLLKYENDYSKSLSYFKRFAAHPSAKNSIQELEIFYDLSVCSYYLTFSNRKDCRILLESTKEKLSKIENKQLTYLAKQIEGNLLCSEYQYNKGIDLLLEVYKALENDPSLKINKYILLNNLAIYLTEIKKYDQAMDFLKLAHKESYNSNNFEGLLITYGNMGNVLAYQEKDQESIDTFLKAITINKKINKKSSNVNIYYNIGLSYTDLENYTKADQYFTKGIELSKETNYEIGLSYHYYGKGYNFFKSKNYAKAKENLITSIKYSREFDNKPILFNGIKDLISIAKLENDAATVLKYFDEFQTLQEEYQQFALNEKVEELVLKMDVEKINAKNKLLSQEVAFRKKINRDKNFLIYIESFVVMLILIFVVLLKRSINKKQKMNIELGLQRKETESVNKSLIRLIADRDNLVKTIIHDLRNPLSAIKGCSALISQEVDENEKEILLNMMNSSSNRLDMLISSLLNSYTADDEHLDENQLVLTKVDEFIKNIVENFEFEAKLKNIEITSFLEPLKLKVNQNGLFSVVGNLISNSIKYSPKNTIVKLSLLNEKQAWKIIVSDQGPGFTFDDYDKMFQLQTTLSSSPTGNEISTGIGLYSVKKTVERYKGTIVLNKDYTKGAEFIITFPKSVKTKVQS